MEIKVIHDPERNTYILRGVPDNLFERQMLEDFFAACGDVSLEKFEEFEFRYTEEDGIEVCSYYELKKKLDPMQILADVNAKKKEKK